MLRRVVLICTLLTVVRNAAAQDQSNRPVPVEVVATASEYVPLSTTISHPGHSYTNCLGSTSYFGRFESYGDSGSISGTADTNTRCSTTFSPPTETTLTTYRRVNYIIAKGEQALYLLSCTQIWQPNPATRFLAVLRGMAEVAASDQSQQGAKETLARGPGKWSECPAFDIGIKYALTVNNTSDARLESPAGGKPIKLEYLSSVGLSAPSIQPAQPPQTHGGKTTETRVHVTSSPSGGEIYVDGKFFGNAPSDITIPTGEHTFKVLIGGREWSRSVEITAGEITIHADVTDIAGPEAEHSTQKTEVAVPLQTSTHPETNGTVASDAPSAISVTSDPIGAEIYVDDSFAGYAPLTLELKPGQHSIRAFANNYKNWIRWITIAGGSEVRIAATMKKLD